MKVKHGLSQYRLNAAKSHALEILEEVYRIEMIFQMSKEGLIDEEIAENYIARNITGIHTTYDYFKSYMEQRKEVDSNA